MQKNRRFFKLIIKKNIAIFASGNGSNFISIYNSIKKGSINGRIGLLISNRAESGAVRFAAEKNIQTKILSKDIISSKKKYINFLKYHLKNYETDLIILAGYLKIIPKEIISIYKHKILNIHPSLLPKYGGKGFYGIKVHEQVINAKEKHSGATVHFVDEIYDNGPIIAQHRVHVSNDETAKSLSKKVLEIEHKLFPYVVKKICENKVKFIKGKPLIQEY